MGVKEKDMEIKGKSGKDVRLKKRALRGQKRARKEKTRLQEV